MIPVAFGGFLNDLERSVYVGDNISAMAFEEAASNASWVSTRPGQLQLTVRVPGTSSPTATTSKVLNSTCGFDRGTDQVSVTAEDRKLGPLQDNGGPTMTHALLPGSVAIDVIPADACDVDEDQRGEPRPGGTKCDVGAFELQ
jgi:hypothetical protein